MILANAKTEVQTQNIGRTAQATVNSSARIFSFFGDKIYSNSFIAIWRELVANGMDAQVVAGRASESVVVTLPTDYTPYAKVRDFGTGMSEVFLIGDPDAVPPIPSKFMAYTDASTKENSNSLIGGFGIGSKSPLSYTEQFAIHSYQDGVCKIYSVFKDEDGCPRITKLAENPTTEPDGVEISFPVEAKDIRSFREVAPETLKYFNPLPALVNSAEPLFAPEYTVKTATWGFLKGATTSRVIMGGIAYPVSHRCMSDMEGFGIDFFVPIGACSIALSREQLDYDERTIRVLTSLVESMKPDLKAHVSAMFANCKTLWEAQALYSQEIRTGNPTRTNLVRQNAFWNGTKLNGVFYQKNILPKIRSKLLLGLITTSKYGKHNYGYWTEGTSNPTTRNWLSDISPRDIKVVLIDDGPKRPILRARRFLEENDIADKGVMFLRPQTGQDVSSMEIKRLLVALGRPPVQLLSEIEPAVVVAGPRGPSRAEKVRAYRAEYNFGKPHVNSKYVDTLPATGGYYMMMESFSIPSTPVQATTEQLQASGLTNDQVYWFNKGDFEKIKGNPLWKPALDKFNERLTSYKADHPNMALAQAVNQFQSQYYSYGDPKWNLLLKMALMLGDDCPTGPLKVLRDAHKKVAVELTPADAAMRKLITIDSASELVNLESQARLAGSIYPELWMLIKEPYVDVDEKLIAVYKKLLV
jgi:hypothetical protein